MSPCGTKKKRKISTYKVTLTPHHSEIVRASSVLNAKQAAWRRIKNGFRYGYNSMAEVETRARVKRTD